MKHLSEKQRVIQIRKNKARFQKELKRKVKRKAIALQEEKIKIASRRLGKYQRRMVKLAKLKYGTQGQAL
jgi:hypothetical protein